MGAIIFKQSKFGQPVLTGCRPTLSVYAVICRLVVSKMRASGVTDTSLISWNLAKKEPQTSAYNRNFRSTSKQ